MPQTTQNKVGVWLPNSTQPTFSSRFPLGNRPVLANGQLHTINGTGFGAKIGHVDHINTSGIYDVAIDGTFDTIGRFSGANYVGASNRPTIKNSGLNGKCLQFFQDVEGTPGRSPNNVLAINYDAPVAVGRKIFSSKWVKHTSTSTVGGQWKFDRYQKSTASVSDKASELYWNANNQAFDNKIQVRDFTGVSGAGDKTKYADASSNLLPHGKNTWYRLDTLITLPASYATPAEFKYEMWIYYSAASAPTYLNFTNNQGVDLVNPYGQSGDEWVQHIFQNYFGNGDFGTSSHTLLMDKIYESVGDDRRIEFCDTEDYTQRKRSFIQAVPTSATHPGVTYWSDAQINFVRDMGDLTSGWYHVIVNGVSVASQRVN